MQVETGKMIDWLSRMVQIPSVCNLQAGPRAGTPGEGRMAEALAQWFEHLGGEVELEEALPGRPNIYSIWRGQTDRWVALDVHTDTVGVETMTEPPFDGRVENERVYGRGAVDTKASLAVMATLLEARQRQGQHLTPNLIVAGTVNEETGGEGGRAYAEWLRRRGLVLDELMVAEPTLCAPIFGHKGGMSLDIDVQGVAAHSAQPHLGQNAVVAAAHMILALDQEHERLQRLTPQTEVGNPSLAVTMTEGGTGRNVVPDACRVVVNRRAVPSEDIEVEAAALAALATRHCPLPITITQTNPGSNGFYQDPKAPWVQQLSAWSGQAPTVAPFGTNAVNYGGLSHQTVVLGPGSIDQAHGAVEWVEIAELVKLSRIYGHWLGLGELQVL